MSDLKPLNSELLRLLHLTFCPGILIGKDLALMWSYFWKICLSRQLSYVSSMRFRCTNNKWQRQTKYLSDNVFSMWYWSHSSQDLQKYNTKAINITFVRKFTGQEVFRIKVTLQAHHAITKFIENQNNWAFTVLEKLDLAYVSRPNYMTFILYMMSFHGCIYLNKQINLHVTLFYLCKCTPSNSICLSIQMLDGISRHRGC